VIIDSIANKEKILKNFLAIASIEGWSDESLKIACKQSEIDEQYLSLIFEDGILSLIDFYIEYYNNLLEQQIILQSDFLDKKISEKIKIATTIRFEIEKSNRQALQRISSFFFSPNNLIKNQLGVKPLTLAFLCSLKISDKIWKLINDQSIDINYYTKRIILAKIIARVFFVFINDEDQNIAKTKNFIDHQIIKILSFTKLKFQAIDHLKNLKSKLDDLVDNEQSIIKTPKEIIKSLPFFRLLKFK